VAADASTPDGDVTFVSHAHGDHLYQNAPENVICSRATSALAAHRRPDEARPTRVEPDGVELIDSGHVVGSRAVCIEHDDVRVLYTGDVSTRDRFFLNGFDPVEADVLVIESTYGTPEYEFAPQGELEAALEDFIEETSDSPILLFGYTLGRAQELQMIADGVVNGTLYVSEAIHRMGEVISRFLERSLPGERYEPETVLEPGDVLILPSQTNRLAFVDRLTEQTGAIRVGASGWAIDDSYKYRADLDETFVLSDHCDFPELMSIVEDVDPEVVYTQHGFADEFAREITARTGIRSVSLKPNQQTLDDF